MVMLTEVRYDDDGQGAMRKRPQDLKSIQGERNLRRIGAEQDHTLNLHQKDSRIKSNMKRKTVKVIALAVFVFALSLGMARHAQAQDAKTPYPSIDPLDQ